VTALATAEAVLALPEEPPFELMLTDLMLPDANGADLAALAGVRWPGMRVVLMSGYTASEAVRRVVESGQVHYLQKPFDIESLARELRAALDEAGRSEAQATRGPNPATST
jgi:two-component system cell cycle sensor histidine kinase/response regulator CckA